MNVGPTIPKRGKLAIVVGLKRSDVLLVDLGPLRSAREDNMGKSLAIFSAG